jgi:MoxR-like ATPase
MVEDITKMNWQAQSIPFPIATPLIERTIHDRILNLAVLTREHVLFSGKPGTAKSLQASVFFSSFIAKTFSVQLSKFSTEEILFGPLNIPKLREGIIEYLCENSILTCDFAFIDEIFDASDVVLRTLLGVLNERIFAKGSFQMNVPLISTVATANYTRINEVTEAVVDRFMLQYYVEPVKDKAKLIGFQIPQIEPKIPLDYLRFRQGEVEEIKFAPEYHGAYLKICQNFGFSDRRTLKGIKILKANALLDNRTSVGPEDFQAINYMVGVDKNKIQEATQFISQVIGNTRIRNDQLQNIKNINDQFNNLQGKHDSKKHLLYELNLLKSLKMIQPIDDIVEEQRKNVMNALFQHYETNRKMFMDKLQVRDLLNAADFK